MKKIINTETNEIIERELTPAEIEQEEKDAAQLEKEIKTKAKEDSARATAKAALLERLGLTQEEFNTLTA